MTRVAALQMTSTTDVDGNLRQAAGLIAEAAVQGAELIVLPENFAYYGQRDLSAAAEREEKANGPVRSFIADQARRHGIWLVGGSLPLNEANSTDKPYAACLLINPRGKEVARYDKIHLFDVDVGDVKGRYCESDNYRHGDTPLVVDTPLGRLGLAVCYDLRFPELWLELAGLGAEIVALPSAFTALTGAAHWQLLLRARAVENLYFVIGANMGDREHVKTPTWGGSAIVSPWGEILAERQGGPGIVLADIDPKAIYPLRKKMPVHEHRRLNRVKK